MVKIKKITIVWIIFMFLVTFTCLLTDLVAQQSLRLGANELPAQLAVDTALQLQTGKNPNSIMPADKIDISKSMDPFVMVFDDHKNLLASSGRMGQISYPKGVLENMAQNVEKRVTWQPHAGLRFASVAMKSDQGYIVAARSLYETENLIDHLGGLILKAWLACLVCSGLALTVLLLFIKKLNQKSSF